MVWVGVSDQCICLRVRSKHGEMTRILVKGPVLLNIVNASLHNGERRKDFLGYFWKDNLIHYSVFFALHLCGLCNQTRWLNLPLKVEQMAACLEAMTVQYNRFVFWGFFRIAIQHPNQKKCNNVCEGLSVGVGGTLLVLVHMQTLVGVHAYTWSHETCLGASSITLQDFSSLFNGVVSVSLEIRWTVM